MAMFPQLSDGEISELLVIIPMCLLVLGEVLLVLLLNDDDNDDGHDIWRILLLSIIPRATGLE